MFLKNAVIVGDNVKGQMVSLGGVRMQDGRTWKTASTLTSRTIDITDDCLDLGQLTTLKSFQITSSHNNKTTLGSVIPLLTNAAAVDLQSSAFDDLEVILYGGQYCDRVVTSNEVITIKGSIEENINNSQIDVTRYPAKVMNYHEFEVPEGWNTGKDQVQKGEIPASRTGHKLDILRRENGSTLLISTGGHCKPSIIKPFFHPEDSINVLQVPSMKWKCLESNSVFKRSFHGQAVNENGELIIIGGKSLVDGRWSKIHSLTEVLIIKFNEDLTYVGRILNINSSISEMSYLTNFSFSYQDNKLFVFSGFKFPGYDGTNLHRFLPPNTSRDKLPELGTRLIKIDLINLSASSCEGPSGCGSFNGSITMVNTNEMIITADPKMYFFSDRALQSPLCDLDQEFGGCTLGVASKERSNYQCSTPVCQKIIHLKCDKTIRGKSKGNKYCPTCAKLDPVTWKKRNQILIRNKK